MRFALALSVLATPAALAHSGHGETEPGTLAHYAFEPIHSAILGVVIAVIVLLVIAAGRRADRKASDDEE